MEIKVESLPKKFDSLSSVFDKYCSVFGIHVFATSKTPQAKVLYAGNVIAEYLDNDGDGEVDNPFVLKSMLNSPQKQNSKRILCLHGGGGNKNSLIFTYLQHQKHHKLKYCMRVM